MTTNITCQKFIVQQRLTLAVNNQNHKGVNIEFIRPSKPNNKANECNVDSF